ncbi:ABC transporter ATP-binding protein/permease [Patescibacteria group bacterium]|nr:ABC transporter ATP-binding protein/permease [Patescibacteria group bacterium]
MLKLLRHLKPFLWMLVLLVILVWIQVQVNLSLPDYLAEIINKGIVVKDQSFIWKTGGTMLLISLLGAVATVGVGYLAAQIGTGFARNVRDKLFSKVESFSLAEFGSFSTASLITRSTNDIQQVQMVLVILLRLVLMAPLMGIGAIIKAYQLAPSMTWIMALAVIVMMGIISILFAVAIPRFQKLQKLVDRLNLVTREILTGLRVIRAFNTEKYEEKKFDIANADLTNANLFVNRLMVVTQPMMMLIMNATSLAIIWVGAQRIDTGTLQIGDMIAFMQYGMQVIFSFLMISIIFIMVPRASVSAQRVEEVLEVKPIITDPERPVRIDTITSGLVEFEDVTFSYSGADEPVLKNISFVAKPGETTALIGSTGSGKSTLINLIPRFYDVTSGRVKIDGVDVRDLKMEDLYRKIGYVPQQGVLFSGTVESNIKYGAPHASDDEVHHVSRIAQASEFVEKLDGEYQAPIAQGGANVSGGQKQRLSIARALARKPEIYIFDDSFSALDFKTDAALRHALNTETKNKTVLIVGQRISTIMNADKIIVLDEGRIVGQGRHRELLKDNPVYREIALSQLSEEELFQKEQI